MNPIEFKRRIETAVRIFEVAAANKQVALVINDQVATAAQQIDQIAREGVVDQALQEKGRALAKQLQAQTQKLLDTL